MRETDSSLPGGAAAASPPAPPAGEVSERISLATLRRMKEQRHPIVMLTCYDFPTAKILGACGVHILLVGDSAATTVLGEASTIHATMDFMLAITRAVRRGTDRPLIMGDMPFGSYVDVPSAMANARRLLCEGGADVVKIEADRRQEPIVAALAGAGVPVCAHLGLLPQRVGREGGYHYQGRTREQADRIVQDALLLVGAGAELLLLEAVPDAVSRRVVDATSRPVLGCGAGPSCHGHVVVLHDLLGLSDKTPRFVDKIADLPAVISQAVRTYVADVGGRRYPEPRHLYHMRDDAARK